MKQSKSFLALLLVLVMVLAPVLSPLQIHAAGAFEITGVSGDANSIKLTTSVPYSTVASAFMSGELSANLHTYPDMGLNTLEETADHMAVIVLKPIRDPYTFTAGRYSTIYGDSTITLSGETINLGQDHSYWFDGSSWSTISKTGNLSSGYTFEENGHALNFEGIGGDNVWRDAVFTVVSYDQASIAPYVARSLWNRLPSLPMAIATMRL